MPVAFSFYPLFASALFNIFSVLFGLIAVMCIRFFQIDGINPIEGMAFGVVGGGLVQTFCQLPSLYKQGYRWVPRRGSELPWYRDRALRKMMGMMMPGMVGLAATQTNILVNTFLATSQGPGAVSWLNFAFRLMQFPIGVFGVSLAQATLPRVSAQWADRDYQGISETLTHSLKSAFAVNLPATAGFLFLSESIIQLLFEHGKFSSLDTKATAFALGMYAIGLTAYSVVKILVPASYAMGNTRGPVLISTVTVGVTLILNLSLIGSFGFWGLALGTSVGAFVNAGLLLFSIQRILGRMDAEIPFLSIGKSLMIYSLVSATMGLLCYFSMRLLNFLPIEDQMIHYLGSAGVLVSRCVKIAWIVGEGAGFVMLISKLVGLSEMEEFAELFVSKLKNKLRLRAT